MNVIHEILLVGCGGMLGALARHGIGMATSRVFESNLPLGTLIANVLGCFLMGLLIGSGTADENQKMKLLLGVGFMGSLTTFSTFGAETIHHASNSHWSIPTGNLLANLVLGFAAVFIGIVLGRRVFG